MKSKKTGILHSLKRIKTRIKKYFWLTPCAGGLCIRERKWVQELLCVAHKKGTIMLPKGRIKPGETSEVWALREFREETGIYDCELGKFIGTIRDRHRGKIIDFYEIKKPGKIHKFKDEHTFWIPLDEALSQMKHPIETRFLQRVTQRNVS